MALSHSPFSSCSSSLASARTWQAGGLLPASGSSLGSSHPTSRQSLPPSYAPEAALGTTDLSCQLSPAASLEHSTSRQYQQQAFSQWPRHSSLGNQARQLAQPQNRISFSRACPSSGAGATSEPSSDDKTWAVSSGTSSSPGTNNGSSGQASAVISGEWDTSSPSSSSSSSPSSSSTARVGVIIHPTSLVHPDAVLEEGVEVGPFCTVGPLVRLGQGCKLHASSHVQGDTTLGEQCIVHTGAIVGCDLPGRTRLGSHNKVGHYSVVGIRCQDLKYKEGSTCHLEIGSHNDIREYVQVHRSSRADDCTVIGDHNLIMGSCHVAHDCKLGNSNILANNTLLAGHVILQHFIHTGGAVAVHQFCHVDSYSFLAGGAMVTRDVPLYTMVSGDRAELRGLNLEGLRRSGFSTEEVRDIRKAYQKLFMSTEEVTGFEERLTALEESDLGKQPRVKALLESIRGSFQEQRRGICKFRHWSSPDGV